MGQSGRTWKDSEVERAVAILGKHTSVASAIAEIRAKLDGRENLNEYYLNRVVLSHVGHSVEELIGKPFRAPREVEETEEDGDFEQEDKEETAYDRVLRQDREGKLKAERDELIYQLKDAEARHRVLDALGKYTPPPVIKNREKLSGLREGTAVVMASDWHVEERVSAVSVSGTNEYNLEIAEKRIGRFTGGLQWLIDYARGAWKIRDLVLWLGGDLMSGYIHEELEEDNELSPIETILWLRARLSSLIHTLLADTELENIVIPCSYGNHGRIHKRKRIKTGAQNSFEWLLYQILKEEFAKEPRVTFSADPAPHQYVEAYDKTLHFTHGDSLSYGGGVGGLAIPLGKRVPKWDSIKKADYHHIGHFHQFLDLNHTLVNGSMIGYSDYALEIGAGFEAPRQAFYMLDSKHGKTMVSPIWLEDSDTKTKKR